MIGRAHNQRAVRPSTGVPRRRSAPPTRDGPMAREDGRRRDRQCWHAPRPERPAPDATGTDTDWHTDDTGTAGRRIRRRLEPDAQTRPRTEDTGTAEPSGGRGPTRVAAGCVGPRSASPSSSSPPPGPAGGSTSKLDGNIHTDTSAAHELDKYARDRPASVVRGAENLLLIGSDSRAGSNSRYGRDDGGSPALGHHDPAAPGRRPAQRHRRLAAARPDGGHPRLRQPDGTRTKRAIRPVQLGVRVRRRGLHDPYGREDDRGADRPPHGRRLQRVQGHGRRGGRRRGLPEGARRRPAGPSEAPRRTPDSCTASRRSASYGPGTASATAATPNAWTASSSSSAR